jgi:tetratricopeptide (TPR) repeat protein
MKRAYEIETLDRKVLGLSFEFLIEGAMSEEPLFQNRIGINISMIYSRAIKSEEDNNLVDAIYLYRHIIELYDKNRKDSKIEKQFLDIVLKAMNNLAVICYELNKNEEAIAWFNRILLIDPANELALENITLLKSENS